MLHSTVSRKGGRARSPAKTAANKAKALAFWNSVRSGQRKPPARPRVPPTPDTIGKLLAPYCRNQGIKRLEVFGSAARGTARRGSDVDLIATFAKPIGLRFFGMSEEMSGILGAKVDLLSRESVNEMTNPVRKKSILADAREIFSA